MYFAVMVAVEEKLVASVACNVAKAPVAPEPLVPEYVTVPLIGVDPFRNCTVPFGATRLLCVFTVAVRVTLAPDTGLLSLELTLVEVAAFVILRASAPEVLAW